MNLNQNHSNIKEKLLKLMSTLGFIILLMGCQTQNQVDLNVSAASSLQESLEEIAALFMEQNPEVNINLNFAGSNVLKRQIVEGFDVDVFLSANVDQFDELAELGMVEEGGQFARNSLVLVTSSDAIQSFYDIANDGVSLIFAGAEVPVGAYAREVLTTVDADHPGFKAAVEANILTQAENVRQVLLKVNLGEGDGAFVYRTDVMESTADHVTVIELPEAYQVISELYMALLSRDEIKDEARQFYEFIFSEAGQEVLANHGFQ